MKRDFYEVKKEETKISLNSLELLPIKAFLPIKSVSNCYLLLYGFKNF